jgi:hypothetical protein
MIGETRFLVAEPVDYFHFAEAPDWGYGLVLQPDRETRPAASVRCRRRSLPDPIPTAGF